MPTILLNQGVISAKYLAYNSRNFCKEAKKAKADDTSLKK